MTQDFTSLETWIELFSVLPPSSVFALIGVLVLAAMGMMSVKQRHDKKARIEREKAAQFAAMCKLVNRQTLEVDTLKGRLQTLESYVDRLNSRQQRVLENATLRKQALDDAISIANRGVTDIDLAQRAGISASEAKLIANLYGAANQGS